MVKDSMLSAIRLSLGSKKEPDVVIDKEMIEELNAQSITPMVVCNNDKYQKIVYQQIAVFSKHLAAQKELSNILLPAGITPVILKGISASYYYPHPELRMLGDIDFLIYPMNEDNFNKAKVILSKNGFAESGATDKRTSFDKNGIHYELHRHFSQRLTEEQIKLDEYIETSLPQKKSINEYEFYSLPDEIIGLVYLDHMAQHITREGLGLRHIIDWVVYSGNYLDDNVWNESFEQMADSIGLKQFAQTIDKMGNIYLGINKHEWSCSIDDEACDEFMKLVDEMGNFGRKEYVASNLVIKKLNKGFNKHLTPVDLIRKIGHYTKKLATNNHSIKATFNDYKEYRKRKAIFEKIGLKNYK